MTTGLHIVGFEQSNPWGYESNLDDVKNEVGGLMTRNVPVKINGTLETDIPREHPNKHRRKS